MEATAKALERSNALDLRDYMMCFVVASGGVVSAWDLRKMNLPDGHHGFFAFVVSSLLWPLARSSREIGV